MNSKPHRHGQRSSNSADTEQDKSILSDELQVDQTGNKFWAKAEKNMALKAITREECRTTACKLHHGASDEQVKVISRSFEGVVSWDTLKCSKTQISKKKRLIGLAILMTVCQ